MFLDICSLGQVTEEHIWPRKKKISQAYVKNSSKPATGTHIATAGNRANEVSQIPEKDQF